MATTQTLKQFSTALSQSKYHLSENEKALIEVRKQLNVFNTSLRNTIGGINKTTFAVAGLTLSVSGLIKEAFNLGLQIIRWRNEFNYLSDATGNATQAVALMMSTWGKSLGSLGEIQSAMGSLAAHGMSISKSMSQLTLFITDMARASGLSVDSLSQLTGATVSYWKVSVYGSKQMTSAILAAGAAFNTTRDQMQDMISVIVNTIDKIGALFKDAEKSAIALSHGVAMSQGALIKLGVTAKTSQDFIGKLLDPSRFEETNSLMRMLGITFEEQMKMYESASGKELFFDKLLHNLPLLSKQIQSIANPLARLRFAESIGLPPEIASKLANASQSQMREIITQYKQKAELDKAAEEKRKKAAAAEAKFSEQLMFLKMQILAPLMNWATGPGWALLQRLRDSLVPFLSSLVQYLTRFLSMLPELLNNSLQKLKSGKLGEALGLFLGKVFAVAIPHTFAILKDMVIDAFKNMDWFGKGIIATLGIIITKKIFYAFQNIGLLIEALLNKNFAWTKMSFGEIIIKPFLSLGKSTKSLFMGGITSFFSHITSFIYSIPSFFSKITKLIGTMVPTIFKNGVTFIFNIIKNLGLKFGTLFIEFGKTLGSKMFSFVKTLIPQAAHFIGKAFFFYIFLAVDFFIGFFKGKGDLLQKTIRGVLNAITLGLLPNKFLDEWSRTLGYKIEKAIYVVKSGFYTIIDRLALIFSNFGTALTKLPKLMSPNYTMEDYFKELEEEQYGTAPEAIKKLLSYNKKSIEEIAQEVKSEAGLQNLLQSVNIAKKTKYDSFALNVLENKIMGALIVLRERAEAEKREKEEKAKQLEEEKKHKQEQLKEQQKQTTALYSINDNTEKMAKKADEKKPISSADFLLALLGGGPTVGLTKGVTI